MTQEGYHKHMIGLWLILILALLLVGGWSVWWFTSLQNVEEPTAVAVIPKVTQGRSAGEADTQSVSQDNTMNEALISSGTPGDLDGDGIPDERELLYATNPALSDTDGDGFVDSYEIEHLFSPNGNGRLSVEHLAVYCKTGTVFTQKHEAFSEEELIATCTMAVQIYTPLKNAFDSGDEVGVYTLTTALSTNITTSCDDLFEAGSSKNFACSLTLTLLFVPLTESG